VAQRIGCQWRSAWVAQQTLSASVFRNFSALQRPSLIAPLKRSHRRVLKTVAIHPTHGFMQFDCCHGAGVRLFFAYLAFVVVQ
jgi:hypothetical protein